MKIIEKYRYMKQSEKELLALKAEVSQMWKLVLSQLQKAQQSFFTNDLELAKEIISSEKQVDSFELRVDYNTENYIALYSPVAVDLRLALSLIKISSMLERIGDYAVGIARHVLDDDCNNVDPQLLDDLKMEKVFDIVIAMLSESFVTLESENTKMSKRILAKDKEVNICYRNSVNVLTTHLEQHVDQVRCGLKILLLIRKLERIGDQCSNIIEEIVFYVDAKVLKHGGLKRT